VVFIDEPEGTSRGLPLLPPARSSHEVVEARQSRGLECAVWRRACGKANVKMNSRLGGGHYKKKRFLWEASSVQIQAVTPCLYDVRAATYADRWDGLPASLPAARLPHRKRTRAAEHMCEFVMLRSFFQ
jgi:hypothetical protein